MNIKIPFFLKDAKLILDQSKNKYGKQVLAFSDARNVTSTIDTTIVDNNKYLVIGRLCAKMTLNKNQAEELIKVLQEYVDTGNISSYFPEGSVNKNFIINDKNLINIGVYDPFTRLKFYWLGLDNVNYKDLEITGDYYSLFTRLNNALNTTRRYSKTDGKITMMHKGDLLVRRFNYNNRRQLTRVTRYNGDKEVAIILNYDDNNRLISMMETIGDSVLNTENYEYDSDNNITRINLQFPNKKNKSSIDMHYKSGIITHMIVKNDFTNHEMLVNTFNNLGLLVQSSTYLDHVETHSHRFMYDENTDRLLFVHDNIDNKTLLSIKYKKA